MQKYSKRQPRLACSTRGTSRQGVADRRSYKQFCGIARGLDLVGERWTILIVRDLLLGPQRFSDLQAGLPALTPNLLTQRLQQMQQDGLIVRRQLPRPAHAMVYELTPVGRALEPALLALGKWGMQFMAQPRPDEQLSARWALFSLLRRFLDTSEPAAVALRVRDATGEIREFRIHVAPGQRTVAEGLTGTETVLATADDAPARMWAVGRAKSGALESAGQFHIVGDRNALRVVERAFGLRE